MKAWYANCPGLEGSCPSNAYDAKGLLKSAIRDNNPVIFMELNKCMVEKDEVPEEEYLIRSIGKAEVKMNGKDVTLVVFGMSIKQAHR